jgi:hypothetical protein
MPLSVCVYVYVTHPNNFGTNETSYGAGFIFGKSSVLFSAGAPAILNMFSHSFQICVKIVPRLNQDRFLLNPYQFIIHLSSYHT